MNSSFLFDWMENSKTFEYQSIVRIKPTDAEDGLWIEGSSYTTNETRKRKFIESDDFFKVPSFKNEPLTMVKWHLLCEKMCDIIHVLIDFSGQYQSYFQFSAQHNLRFQWDPLHPETSSIDFSQLRNEEPLILGPSQCLDKSSGRVVLDSALDQAVSDWKTHDYPADYFYAKYQSLKSGAKDAKKRLTKWWNK